MPQTKKIMVGLVPVILYSLDGRNWFNSPLSCIATQTRLRAEGDRLRESWNKDPHKMDYEIETAGGDLGGTITLNNNQR